jgi:PAS domain S-box-containing protein
MQCLRGHQFTAQCLESILQTLAEGLFLTDEQGTILYCNKALETMTGKSSEQIVGQKCCTLMKELCTSPPDCKLFSKGEIINTECSLIHRSGKIIPVLKNARVLKDNNGNILGAVETITDISVLKETEQRLYLLEQSTASRKQFSRM